MERHELRPIPDDNYRNILEHIPIACVDIAIYNHNNQLLMIKRRFAPAVGQFWLPGGRAHKGESRRGAAHRKLVEETGLTAQFLVELLTSETIFGDGPGDIPVHSINTVYFTMIKEGAVNLDEQSSEFDWRAPDGWLGQGLHPYVERAVRESSALIIGEG